MKNKLKILTEFIAGYPSLNFNEANYAAYLQAFEVVSDEDFNQALLVATQESPSFFPTLPVLKKAYKTVQAEKINKRKQEEFNKQFTTRPYEDPEPRSSGWLYKLFLQKKAEFKKV